MKKILILLLLGNLLFLQMQHAQKLQSASCFSPSSQTDLDIANIRATIRNGGDMWDAGNGYEVPKGSGKLSMFAGAMWIGGIDAGFNIRMAAQTYRQNGNDFWPGPIDTTTGSITSATCSQFNRFWKINRADVESFAAGGSATNEIITYPGNGDALNNATHYLAPFFDLNNDGIYNYTDGDYPLFQDATSPAGCNCGTLHGDQVLWWVINDVGNNHTQSGSTQQIGLEIQCQAFAYSTMDEDLANATFYEYKIINRSPTQLDSTMFGFWADVDLGNYLDDYVGCDVGRGLAYGYNADNNDEGFSGYGINPPAIGVDFIRGPAADAGDGVDNDRDSCIDCTFLKDSNGVIIDTIPDYVYPELIKMSKFISYENNGNVVNGNPGTAEEYYGYLRGVWRNGAIMTYGGNGYGSGNGATTDPCDFMYPGSSDPNDWGTHGVPENDWSESIAGNIPDDRRFLSSTGPYTMYPGQVQCIQTAVLWARDTAGALSSVTKLKHTADRINTGISGCLLNSLGIQENTNIIATLFPNPVVSNESIKFNKHIKNGVLSVYDIAGNLLHKLPVNGSIVQFSSNAFIPGVYLYRVQSDKNTVASGKFVKE